MGFSQKQQDRRQHEFDKLYNTYAEEGIQLGPWRFPISYFFAIRMASAKIHEGVSRRNRRALYAEEIVDVEVAPGVIITKEDGKYYLDYEDAEQADEYLEYWLNLF